MWIAAESIVKWETGEREPSLPWIEVLSRVFDFDLPWLDEDTELDRFGPPFTRKGSRSGALVLLGVGDRT